MSYFNTESILFDPSNMSAFGTLETNELTPLIQFDFVYGINTQIGVTSFSGTGATVSTSLSKLVVTSGTSNNGYAIFNSRKPVKYRAGQGITARFTAVFGTPNTQNTQVVGAASLSLNAPYDGYLFGYNGTTFGIFLYTAGVQTFIAQSTWNGDICNGTGASGFNLNQQDGNVYMVKYPYLGYGNIGFFIQNSLNSRWILVHTIQYTNAHTATQLLNPNLYFVAESFNTASGTTSVTINCGSVGFFMSGVRSFIGSPRWAADNIKSGITTETCVLNLQNCTSYNGITNRSLIRLNSISVVATSGGTNLTTIKLKINSTIGGTPSYTPINGTTANNGLTITSGNSIASYDTAGTTVSGGLYEFNFIVQNSSGGNGIIDLTQYELYLNPGDVLSITAVSSISAQVGVSLNWTEDI